MITSECCCSTQRPCLLSAFYGVHLKASRSQQIRVRGNARKTLTAQMSRDNREQPEVLEAFPDYGFPQNMELPPILSKKKKKPYVRPIKLLLKESRLRKKLGIVPGFWLPPRNGLLVAELIPVARNLLKQKAILDEGVRKLMEVIPVRACSCCPEIHIGSEGHLIRSCRGSGSARRNGLHVWITGTPNDVVVPIESYHIVDRLGPPIIHEQRYSIPRLPAITELCIQAGVDHPDYPVVRWARNSGRQVGHGRAQVAEQFLQERYYGAQESDGEEEEQADTESSDGEEIIDGLEDAYQEDEGSKTQSQEEVQSTGFVALGTKAPGLEEAASKAFSEEFEKPASEMSKEELARLAERTLVAFDSVRKGVQTLMKKYPIRACGYCSEVQVGPRGHRVKLCGAFKHQQRDGKHGWQEAALSDVFPPNFVWHVPSGFDPALRAELKAYYGQAPAVVELCVQAGSRVPRKWSPFMRIDTVVPDLEERYFVF